MRKQRQEQHSCARVLQAYLARTIRLRLAYNAQKHAIRSLLNESDNIKASIEAQQVEKEYLESTIETFQKSKKSKIDLNRLPAWVSGERVIYVGEEIETQEGGRKVRNINLEKRFTLSDNNDGRMKVCEYDEISKYVMEKQDLNKLQIVRNNLCLKNPLLNLEEVKINSNENTMKSEKFSSLTKRDALLAITPVGKYGFINNNDCVDLLSGKDGLLNKLLEERNVCLEDSQFSYDPGNNLINSIEEEEEEDILQLEE